MGGPAYKGRGSLSPALIITVANPILKSYFGKKNEGKIMSEDNVQAVTVTRIRIPFGDMVVLYLQVVGAALIVLGIPALIIALIAAG